SLNENDRPVRRCHQTAALQRPPSGLKPLHSLNGTLTPVRPVRPLCLLCLLRPLCLQWSPVSDPFPWRAVARLAAWGLVCAGAVYLAGLFIGYRILGADDDAMRGRIVGEVQRSFATLTAELERRARAVAEPAPVRAALNEDLPATRALFERLAQSPGIAAGDLSLSVYSPTGQPLAWAGRPSELPVDRAQDGESWFI